MCIIPFFFTFCDFRLYTSNKQNAIFKKLKVRFFSKLECILENYCSTKMLRFKEFQAVISEIYLDDTGSVRNFAKCIKPMQYTAIFHGCKNDNFQLMFFTIYIFLLKNQAKENQNKTTALEWSVMNYWGLKLVLRAQSHPQFLKWYKTVGY